MTVVFWGLNLIQVATHSRRSDSCHVYRGTLVRNRGKNWREKAREGRAYVSAEI
jgi:hypothetical protein